MQILQDKIANPATIIGRIEQNYEEYLEIPNLQKRSAEPFPFEEFLRKIALKLKKEIGTFKKDEDIFNDITEVIEFMRTLMAGGVSHIFL